ncbi:MAG: hypothetical protein RJQ03_00770 [Miltoncostaeaceae bacterium]
MEHVPAIQKAGLSEANRIAQMVMQRETHMAVLASAGERADRVRSAKVPPPERIERMDDRAEEERHREGHSDDDAGGSEGEPDRPRRHIDLSA